MAVSSSLSGPAGPPETLADLLASGPLSLAAGLRYAKEIATELRDLHREARAYGTLTASSIIMSEAGAHLLPLRQYWDRAVAERDVQAFGYLFYQMLTGIPPPATVTAADIGIRGSGTGPSYLRAVAMNLVLKCLALKGTPPSMQQVATEIRLLAVLLRQYEASTRPARQPAAANASLLVGAAPPAVAPHIRLSVQQAEAATGKNLSPRETGVPPAVPVGRDSFIHPTAEAPAERQLEGAQCPKCDSTAVYCSRARSPFELLLDRWRVPICRCRRCYHRYVVFAGLRISKDMPVGTPHKLKPERRRV